MNLLPAQSTALEYWSVLYLMQSYPAKRPKQLDLTLTRQVQAAVTVTDA